MKTPSVKHEETTPNNQRVGYISEHGKSTCWLPISEKKFRNSSPWALQLVARDKCEARIPANLQKSCKSAKLVKNESQRTPSEPMYTWRHSIARREGKLSKSIELVRHPSRAEH
jgi:hypothetical protein